MTLRTRAGFTLLELLVAIAIVAVLAGLVVTAVRSLRAKSAQVECTSNLRQWGTALGLYMAEHDGLIPRRGQGRQKVQTIDRPDDWFNSLPPYFNLPPYSELAAQGRKPKPGEHSVFVCPEAKDNGAPNFLAYAMNFYLSPWDIDQQSIQQMAHPEQTVFMADGPGGYCSTVPSANENSVQARHSGRANLAFLDGHVQSYAGSYLGCGVGEQSHDEVQWKTYTTQASY